MMVEKVKLNEICDILNGYAFKSEKYVDDGIRVIRITNVQKGFVEDEKPQYYPEEESENIKNYMLFEDDLLLSLTGNVGRVAMLGAEWLPAALNQRVACLRMRKLNIDKKYVFYALLSKKFEDDCIASAQGIAQKNMSTEWLKQYEINLPNIIEQHYIVEVMDKIFSIIFDRKREIDKLNDLIKSRFVEMFGDISTGNYKYETKKLGDVATVGSSHRVFTTEFVDKGIPFYRGTEIGELANGKKPSASYYISKDHYQRLADDETKPNIGDLLMPSICNKGQVWMVDTEEPFYYKDGRVLCISANREIYDTRYLQYFMKLKTEIEYPKLGSGSTFAEFKIFLLKDIDILTPPREFQNQFAAFVQSVDKLKSEIQKSLDETQTLMDSLMQKYFG